MVLEGGVALSVLLFFAAVLYATVGQAGASGYLAAMALFGLSPTVMRPTALVLNVIVATLATVKFYRAGAFSWSLFWPFVVTSVPFAFIGGLVTVPNSWYRPAVGMVLLFVAYQLFSGKPPATPQPVTRPSRPLALGAGGALGLLSGLTGIGGGILLSPLLLLLRWAEARPTAGVSAAFNLVNSLAALAGLGVMPSMLPRELPLWALLVTVGGWIGASYGSTRIGQHGLQRLLAIVLVIAALKLILPA